MVHPKGEVAVEIIERRRRGDTTTTIRPSGGGGSSDGSDRCDYCGSRSGRRSGLDVISAGSSARVIKRAAQSSRHRRR